MRAGAPRGGGKRQERIASMTQEEIVAPWPPSLLIDATRTPLTAPDMPLGARILCAASATAAVLLPERQHGEAKP